MSRVNRKHKSLTPRRLRNLPKKIQLRGKVFNKKQLESIRQIVKTFWNEGRTAISMRICRRMRWRQANGWLKDRACRDVLRKLVVSHLIRLPEPRLKRKRKPEEPVLSISHKKAPPSLVTALVTPISLHLAKGNSAEERWNEIVQE